MATAPPPDAFDPGAFRHGVPNGNWQPPVMVRTAVWLVKDVGVPVVLTGVFVAVMLGWLDSPLLRLVPIDRMLVEHARETKDFQDSLRADLRKQRCMTAITATTYDATVIQQAAISIDPCAMLENLPRPRPGSR